MEKKCNICQQVKDTDAFGKRTKKGRIHLTYACKKCLTKKVLENTDKEKKRAYDLIYRQANKEKIAAYKVNWQRENKEELTLKKRKYTIQRRSITAYNQKSRKNKDPIFKILCNLRTRIVKAVKGGFKAGSSVQDLGCTAAELKRYLESKFYSNPSTNEAMTWQNHGAGNENWQIDHIKALRTFDLTNREEFLKASHYTNLQPLWRQDHVIKTIEDNRLIRNMI